MAELFTNLATSTLAAGITNVATTLTVASGDGNKLFPALTGSDFFRCVLINKTTGNIEIITVTSRTGDVFDVIARKQEEIGNITPAVAYAFNAGDLIELRPTKGFFDSLGAVTTTDIQFMGYNFGVDTGTFNAYDVEITPTPASYAAPLRIAWIPLATNTGASTLIETNLAGTPESIVTYGGAALIAGDIEVGKLAFAIYDDSDFILLNPRQSLTNDVARKSLSNTFAAANIFQANVDIQDTLALQKGTDVGTADVAATILTLPDDGNFYDFDDATDFAEIATLGGNAEVVIYFDVGGNTITHNATDMALPGGLDIVTAAGDIAKFYEYAAGDWRCSAYLPAGFVPGLLDEDDMVSDSDVQGATQQSTKKYVDDTVAAIPQWSDLAIFSTLAATLGTTTSVPASATKVELLFYYVSNSAAASPNWEILLGTGGGTFSANVDGNCNATQMAGTAYLAAISPGASNTFHGKVTFTKLDSLNIWVGTGQIRVDGTSGTFASAGTVTLGATLTSVRVQTTVNAFDGASKVYVRVYS